MTLNAHLRSIWRHRRTVVLVTVAATVIVYVLLSTVVTKQYQATSQISVTIPNTSNGQAVSQTSVLFASNTVAELAGTTPVQDSAAKASGLGIDHSTVASRTSLSPSATVGIIDVKAKGPSPAAALALARGLDTAVITAYDQQQAAAFDAQLAPIKAQIAKLEAQSAKLKASSAAFATDQSELQALSGQLAQAEIQPQTALAVVSPASASSSPVSPKPKTDSLLALLTALILSAELSAFWSYFHDGFSPEGIEEEVRDVLGLPILGRIPRGPRASMDDAFRELRTNLIFLDTPVANRTVAIVGAERGVGRTFCAIQLAHAVGEVGAQVGLIDADLRQRAVADGLALPQLPGLSDALEDPTHLRTHRPIGEDRMTVLTAGRLVNDPAGLVGRGISKVVFPRFTSAELVVIDTPALDTYPDALAIAPLCTATLLVIDPRTSRRRACRQLLARLQQVGANPVGVIVNRSDDERWAPRRRLRDTHFEDPSFAEPTTVELSIEEANGGGNGASSSLTSSAQASSNGGSSNGDSAGGETQKTPVP
jgi:Mrp family chromosome partitioning ATPase/capsular polysaccharide biosynthesis protein